MTIEYFADHQNVVFVPALLALLAATLLICLPIVFAPGLRRGGRARARTVAVVAGALAAVALVTAGWQAGVGVRTLQEQRTAVQRQVEQRYGLALTAGETGELVDGGAPQKAIPALAAALDLKATRSGTHALRLRADGDAYVLLYGGERVPTV